MPNTQVTVEERNRILKDLEFAEKDMDRMTGSRRPEYMAEDVEILKGVCSRLMWTIREILQ
jgi:hypothetical protein